MKMTEDELNLKHELGFRASLKKNNNNICISQDQRVKTEESIALTQVSASE